MISRSVRNEHNHNYGIKESHYLLCERWVLELYMMRQINFLLIQGLELEINLRDILTK